MVANACLCALFAGGVVVLAGIRRGEASPRQSGGHLAPQPVAPVRPVTDDYYGTKVIDNYRYMENLKDPEVQAWMKAQNDYTRAALAMLPGREPLLARVRQLDQSAPRVFAIRLPGDLYVMLKRLATGNINMLYVRRGLGGEDKLLVDPVKVQVAVELRGKGTNAILDFSPSDDNRLIATVIAPGGSERDAEIHVVSTSTGGELSDVIPHAFGQSPVWLPGNRSFVYGKLQKLPPGAPAAEIEQKVRSYVHVLGTDADKDPAVFGYGVAPSIRVDPRDFANVVVAPDSRFAIGSINSGVSPNSAFYIEPAADLGKTNSAWRKVADLSDDVSNIEVHGDDLYVLTYKNALRYKVLRTDARHPNLPGAEVVVAPSEAVVTAISPAQDALYVLLLDGGIGRLLRLPYGPHPKPEEIALPFKGTVFPETDPRLAGAIVGLTSWTRAYRIYRYDPAAKRLTETNLQPVGPYGNPTNIESVEVKARSYDGTLVPLSITYAKGMKLDGSNPTLLDGYGAYGITSSPYFDPTMLAWYERGGVFAECHVRGGGEYGEEWHLAGKGPTKHNTWRDFIACAEYLIDHNYTSPARLAGSGTSAGGVLIGRAITSRPDLFAAAIDWVGCSDMLRVETGANGVPNIAEFGSVKTKAGFEQLYEMSAYNHIKDHTAYPAVLFMTGANDPRVDPWQMDKMAARLQAATSSGKPVLLRVNYQGGHQVIGGTAAQTQGVTADQWSFLLWQFGMPQFQPQL